MDHTNGSDTPDSGMYSEASGSRRSSMSSMDQSNGMHSRRTSTDSGIGGTMSNPSSNGKDTRFSTDLDTQKVTAALTDINAMTEGGMPEITEGLEADNLTSGPRTDTSRSGNMTAVSDAALGSKRRTTDKSIQVYATGPNGKNMPLNIKTGEKVDTLIQHVSKAFGMGSSQNTYLVFNDQTLNLGSSLTVEKAGIKNGSQMQLCTRVVGG